MSERKLAGLMTRVLTALVLLPVSLALVLAPPLGPGFVLLVAAFACAGLIEYYRIAETKGFGAERIPGIVLGTAITLSGSLGDSALTNGALCAGFVILAGLHFRHAHGSVAALAVSFFGLVYVGWFPAHLVLAHQRPEVGRGLVLVLFVTVILTDVAAYFIGRQFGRHKMAPLISPKKTWEGAAGGFVFAVGGACVLHMLRDRMEWMWLPAWSLVYYAIVGAVLSIAAQIGDLMESCLKRDTGIKDSGSLFPGHGGALDRCDGFLLAAPVLYYMALL